MFFSWPLNSPGHRPSSQFSINYHNSTIHPNSTFDQPALLPIFTYPPIHLSTCPAQPTLATLLLLLALPKPSPSPSSSPKRSASTLPFSSEVATLVCLLRSTRVSRTSSTSQIHRSLAHSKFFSIVLGICMFSLSFMTWTGLHTAVTASDVAWLPSKGSSSPLPSVFAAAQADSQPPLRRYTALGQNERRPRSARQERYRDWRRHHRASLPRESLAQLALWVDDIRLTEIISSSKYPKADSFFTKKFVPH